MEFYCNHPDVEGYVEEDDCEECKCRNQRGCKYYNQPSSSREPSENARDKILDSLCGNDPETREYILRCCSRFEAIKKIERYYKKQDKKEKERTRKRLARVRDPERLKKKIITRAHKEIRPVTRQLWKYKNSLSSSSLNRLAGEFIDAVIEKEMEEVPPPPPRLYRLCEKRKPELRKNMMREVYRLCKKQKPDATDNFIFDQIARLLNYLHGEKYTRQDIYYLVKSALQEIRYLVKH